MSGGLTQQSRQQIPKFGVAGRLAQPPSPNYVPLHGLKVSGFTRILPSGMQRSADRSHYLGRIWAPDT